MRKAVSMLLVMLSGNVLPPRLLAGSLGGKAHFIGGTVAVLPSKSEGHVNTTDPETLLFQTKKANVRVPYRDVNLLEYGQRVNRRYAEAIIISPLMLLAKKRQHFVTLGFKDERGQQQAVVFQVDKGDIRAVLASLEARTGLRVEFQDEEARKAGKG